MTKKKQPKPYYMYVLRCSDESYYCGISTDPDRRLAEHNESKRGAKYTRSRRPCRLMFTQKFDTRSEALKKEAAFKKLKRPEKLVYMCDVIEEEMALQVAKMESMEKANSEIESTPKPDKDT